jgi:hypothetical protein
MNSKKNKNKNKLEKIKTNKKIVKNQLKKGPDGVTRRDGGTGGCALDPGINAEGRHPRAYINDG